MKKIILAVFMFIAFVGMAISVFAASVWTTDINGNPVDDFSPNDIVYMNGNGFIPNTQLSVVLTRPDGGVDSCSISECNARYFDRQLTSSPSGSFSLYRYSIDGIFGVYNLQVSDGQNTALFTFTDAPNTGSVWTTDSSCGEDKSGQEVHYPCGKNVFINGNSFFKPNEKFNFTICKILSNSDPCSSSNTVFSGNFSANGTGAIVCAEIWNASSYHPANSHFKIVVFNSSLDNIKQKTFFAGCDLSCGADGTSCNDGNACTTGETCQGGTCQGGTTITCNGGGVCSDNSCNPASGCVYTKNDSKCTDVKQCYDATCNDYYACVYTSNSGKCSDSDACTTDTCESNGQCSHASITCDDGKSCTDNSCNSASGCVYTKNDSKCDDNIYCTSNTCDPDNGDATTGCKYDPKDSLCNDNIGCTLDTCNPYSPEKDSKGCTYTYRDSECSNDCQICSSTGCKTDPEKGCSGLTGECPGATCDTSTCTCGDVGPVDKPIPEFSTVAIAGVLIAALSMFLIMNMKKK